MAAKKPTKKNPQGWRGKYSGKLGVFPNAATYNAYIVGKKDAVTVPVCPAVDSITPAAIQDLARMGAIKPGEKIQIGAFDRMSDLLDISLMADELDRGDFDGLKCSLRLLGIDIAKYGNRRILFSSIFEVLSAGSLPWQKSDKRPRHYLKSAIAKAYKLESQRENKPDESDETKTREAAPEEEDERPEERIPERGSFKHSVEARTLVSAVLGKLAPQEQRILQAMLAMGGDAKPAELAKALKVKPATISTLLYRIRKKSSDLV